VIQIYRSGSSERTRLVNMLSHQPRSVGSVDRTRFAVALISEATLRVDVARFQIAYLTVDEHSIELWTDANGFGTHTAARLTNRLAKDAFNLYRRSLLFSDVDIPLSCCRNHLHVHVQGDWRQATATRQEANNEIIFRTVKLKVRASRKLLHWFTGTSVCDNRPMTSDTRWLLVQESYVV